jgi:hypothetical protein
MTRAVTRGAGYANPDTPTLAIGRDLVAPIALVVGLGTLVLSCREQSERRVWEPSTVL